ncbi:hypothetical protein ICHIJ1_10160 [Fluviibacter phosphoraccumulans]|uniref:Uncharacterized protein n=1 Tax=Fluviibacter phosphoraccumulans TaxID=1751046 RepID=A0A7R6R2Q3_9RHOO|nr:hypothetical protein ICHIAU1_20030 [Fluviibacter phosphoraccumulans]BBU71097.1 hypothetical protein ICHIJ1_10160 [Fluviibacter phosphoraccumulans]
MKAFLFRNVERKNEAADYDIFRVELWDKYAPRMDFDTIANHCVLVGNLLSR